MAIQKGYESYQQQNMISMPTYELVFRLYEQSQHLLEDAKVDYDRHLFSLGEEKVIKTKKIFFLLQQSVDMRMRLGKQLNTLYQFLSIRLNSIITMGNSSVIEEILPLISELKQAWEEGIKALKERDRYGVQNHSHD